MLTAKSPHLNVLRRLKCLGNRSPFFEYLSHSDIMGHTFIKYVLPDNWRLPHGNL